jgi:glycerophosphoryl diester phosphodiesterase
MQRLLLLGVACLFAGCATTIDVQGHRGARGLAPENTLPAFATALSLGVTTLELDTGITRDGVVVISHDPFLNPDIVRGPDGKWLAAQGPAISSLTFAELQQYELGRIDPASNYAKRYPEQKPVDGTRFPRLSDLFALVRKSGNTKVRFNIETKTSPTEPDKTLPPGVFTRILVDLIRKEDMARRVTIQSFDWRTLQIAQMIAPEMPTVYLTAQQKFFDNILAGEPEDSQWTAGFQYRRYGSIPRMVKAAGGAVWSPYFGDVTAEKVKEAQGLGLKVVVWTVNDIEQMKNMLDFGVDGIISDRPDILRTVMAGRKLPVPVGTPVLP